MSFRALMSVFLLTGLAACGGDAGDSMAEEADDAAAAVEEAAGEVAEAAGDVAEAAGDAMAAAEEAVQGVSADDQEAILQTGLLGEWQWVGFQGMDDSTITVDDPSAYTLYFRVDGVQVTADCNTGQGGFDLDGPNITFSPIAMTMMACPAESLGERFASQLGYVRSWMIQDGHLFLSLMADGGIMEFQPGGEGA